MDVSENEVLRAVDDAGIAVEIATRFALLHQAWLDIATAGRIAALTWIRRERMAEAVRFTLTSKYFLIFQ